MVTVKPPHLPLVMQTLSTLGLCTDETMKSYGERESRMASTL
jgi:hypothetical protein